MKKGDIIEIKWVDSVSEGTTWVNEDSFDFASHDRSMLYKSTGYFVRRTKVAVYLCKSYRINKKDGGKAISHLFAIPNGTIKSIKRRR
mgnify:CR=1 FL=1